MEILPCLILHREHMKYTVQSSRAQAVCTTLGGEMISFVHDNIRYLWTGDEKWWGGHAPVLFPVVCTPKDMQMAHDGVSYPMPKHGFAAASEFEPVLLTPERVSFQLKDNPHTRSMFPFRFSLTNTYTVSDTGFSASFTTENLDVKPMTYCIGGHPGFRCPLEDGEEFADYRLEFTNAEGVLLTGTTPNGLMEPNLPHLDLIHDNILRLADAPFESQSTLIAQNLASSQVKLISEKTGRGILLDFTGFNALGIWSYREIGSPFVCLEPWNGLPAGSDETTEAKSKKYARTLQPGDAHTVSYTVTIL